MRFFSTLVAATLGTLVALGIVVFFFFLLIVAIVSSSGESTPSVAAGSTLVLELDGTIPEVTADDPFASAFGGKQPLDLVRVQQVLRMAAADDRVDALWLKVGALATPWATLEEIRTSLDAYRKTGKPLYASADTPYLNEAGYFLASAADTVVMAPLTIFEFNGFTITAEFYKKLLDKLDVEAQVVRVGTFKGAVEPFIREDLSPENRAQLASLLAEQNRIFLQTVARSRGTTPEALQALIETKSVFSAEGGLEAGLLDALLAADELESIIKRRTGVAEDEDLSLLNARDYAATSATAAGLEVAGEGEIAIVYAVGAIMDGESGESFNPLMGGTVVGDVTFRKAMQQARESESVKAVVLRINSPGGSASASEAMRREVLLTREVKPVIVSMGDYAASGGYWIATGADTIVADPLTITGSIGVFNLLFDAGGFFENQVGITFDQVQTGPFADLPSVIRPLEPAERALLQESVNKTYSLFLQHVAAATQLDTARVSEIAQGRVWTGVQAKELGLVHELGGLRRALEIAAARVGIEGNTYRIRVLPKPKSTLERMLESMNAQARTWIEARQSPLERQLRDRATALDALFRQNGQVQALLPTRIVIE